MIYNKRLKETKDLPDKEINLVDFIDVKGMKSLGNQLTKLKVKEVELLHEINGGEPWPDDLVEEAEIIEEDTTDSESNPENLEAKSDEESIEMEWDLTKKENPIKDEDDDSQTELFE